MLNTAEPSLHKFGSFQRWNVQDLLAISGTHLRNANSNLYNEKSNKLSHNDRSDTRSHVDYQKTDN